MALMISSAVLLYNPNSKIWEIGCGPGNITKYILSKLPDLNIFGIDIAPNRIELAKKIIQKQISPQWIAEKLTY